MSKPKTENVTLTVCVVLVSLVRDFKFNFKLIPFRGVRAETATGVGFVSQSPTAHSPQPSLGSQSISSRSVLIQILLYSDGLQPDDVHVAVAHSMYLGSAVSCVAPQPLSTGAFVHLGPW